MFQALFGKFEQVLRVACKSIIVFFVRYLNDNLIAAVPNSTFTELTSLYWL